MNLRFFFLFGGWLMLFGGYAFAQEKESMESIWVFSDSIGIDFQGEKPKLFDVVTPDSNARYRSHRLPNASIYINKRILYCQIMDYHVFIPAKDSNSSSKYLVYFGCNICNEKNRVIKNGDSLIIGDRYRTCIFLPVNDSTIYFLGTADNDRKPRIYYSKLQFISGSWRVTEKNVKIGHTDVRQMITGVRHYNGKDWWLFAHERNNSNGFLRFLVSQEGVTPYPTQYIGSVHYPVLADPNALRRYGYSNIFDLEFASRMKVSKDGTKLGVISSVKGPYTSSGLISEDTIPILDVFDINRCTGELSNWQKWGDKMPTKILENHGIWSDLEFTNYNKHLFFACFRGIGPPSPYPANISFFRFNLTNQKFDYYVASKCDTFSKCTFVPSRFYFYSRDNKIYLTNNVASRNAGMGCIMYPDTADIRHCGYTSEVLSYGGKIPNHTFIENPHYDLGPVPPLPLQKNPVAYRDTLCPLDTARLGGYFPAGRFVHRWSPMTGLSYAEGDSGTVLFQPTAIPQQDTLYTFVMTTSGRPNTCHDGEMTTDTFRVLVHGRNHRPCFVSVPEPEAPSSPKILIYPNPATTSVHVQFDLNEESAKVIFYNVMGVAVHRQDLAGKKGTIAIETRNWASGVYTAKIIGRNGENLGVSKLVIVK